MKMEFGGLSFSFAEGSEVHIPPVAIFLFGLLLCAVMAWFYLSRKRARSSSIKYSDVRIVKRSARSSRQRFRGLLLVLRLLALSALIVAFARPRSGTEYQEVSSEGIDIMICLDVSTSMMAEDFKPNNRLHVAKEEIKKFIQRRINDRIGLVVFARYAYTQCPLTTDYGVLIGFTNQVGFGTVEDGTAIGMAMATGINRLRDSDGKSKVMILVTDGDNNAGEIDPLTAAKLGQTFDIKIYTIGVGKPGNAMFPYNDPIFGKRYVYQPTKIDEASLKEIAALTGGKYFRARSGEELDEIYSLIDNMEKTEVKVAAHIQYTELFHYFALAGLLLVAMEIVLANTYFRKLP
jgi:Ca-activated chloride channel homolog